MKRPSNFFPISAAGMKTAGHSNMCILVVDDESVVLDLIAEQLEGHGYSVVVASGVETALEALAEDHFRLVLTDIRMAPLDGYALLREVLSRNGEMPVLLMSSFAPPEAAEQARGAGAAGFLRKPFTQQQLVDVVSACLPGLPS